MSSFQYENVILPDNAPVVLVNRDWQIPGRMRAKSRQKTEDHRSIGLGKTHTFRLSSQTTSPSDDLKRSPPVRSRNGSSPQSSQDHCSHTSVLTLGKRRISSRTSKRKNQRSSDSEDSHTPDAINVTSDSFRDRHHDQAEQLSPPGINASLMQLATYATPDFIPKASFLNYYVINVADHLYPLKGLYKLNPLLSVWLPIVLVDELWFYCILYTVARHLHASRRHRSYESECVYLADILYQKLRTRLEGHLNGVGLTDVDCAAVACLLGVEHAFGSKEGASQHARGLASFVDKRGGVDSISGVLRTKICRADVECAIDHSCDPAIRYPPDGKPNAARHNLPELIDGFKPISTHMPSPTPLDEPLIGIANDFLPFVASLQYQISHAQLLDPFVLDDSVLCLQHRLAQCRPRDLTPLGKAFRAACLIFIKCLIRPLEVVAQTSEPLAKQIQLNMDLSQDISRISRIWILFMGLIAGRPLQQQRILISAELVGMLKGQDGRFPSWPELRKDLKKFAWIDAILDGVGEEIWSELDAVALV